MTIMVNLDKGQVDSSVLLLYSNGVYILASWKSSFCIQEIGYVYGTVFEKEQKKYPNIVVLNGETMGLGNTPLSPSKKKKDCIKKHGLSRKLIFSPETIIMTNGMQWGVTDKNRGKANTGGFSEGLLQVE